MNTEEMNLDDIDQCSPDKAYTGPKVYQPTHTTSNRRGMQRQGTQEVEEEDIAINPSAAVHDSGVGITPPTNNTTQPAPLKTTAPHKPLESSDSLDVADF